MKQHTGAPKPHPAALEKSGLDALEPIYARMRHIVPAVEWAVHAPYVAAINELKRERNAVVLAHNYQTPEIFYGIADYTGDSLGLAQQAAATDAEVIVQCGVHFMAETSKVLSPHKTVLIPEENAKDLADIPKNVLDALNVYMVQTMDEVLKVALTGTLPATPPPVEPEPADAEPVGDDQITH